MHHHHKPGLFYMQLVLANLFTKINERFMPIKGMGDFWAVHHNS